MARHDYFGVVESLVLALMVNSQIGLGFRLASHYRNSQLSFLSLFDKIRYFEGAIFD